MTDPQPQPAAAQVVPTESAADRVWTLIHNLEVAVAEAKAEREREAEVAATTKIPDPLDPPRWVHHPSHMKGWEAFGVTDHEHDPIVRRLGMVTFTRGGEITTEEHLGTEPWGSGEVMLGVAGVNIVSSADGSRHAYIYVVGTDRADVEARWHTARSVWNEVAGRVWPTSRTQHYDGTAPSP